MQDVLRGSESVSVAGWALELCIPEFVPEAFGDAPSIVLEIVACDILADLFDIACEQEEGVRVETRIDGLREVNNFRLTLPVKDVVAGEVAMHIVVSQPELDIAQQGVENCACLHSG